MKLFTKNESFLILRGKKKVLWFPIKKSEWEVINNI